jgi:RND superfamily putative drug exporter
MTSSPNAPRQPSRKRWALPTLLLVVWLAGGGPLVSFAAKLSGIQRNDNAAFLPANAEATEVGKLQLKFTERENVPAIVIYERRGGITPSDRQAIDEDVRSFQGIKQVVGRVSPPIPSADGQAVQVVVPLDANAGRQLNDGVDALRARAQSHPGLTVHVTGPGGLLANLSGAFSQIDGLLLAVTLVAVFLILATVYRSPLLPVLVLGTAALALGVASTMTYILVKQNLFKMNGQSQGILSILTIGACTDYALLLVARFREELRHQQSPFSAIRSALRASSEPIIASGCTVILGVMCLLFSDLNSNKALGPVAALAIGASLLAALTFLPAVLAVTGRAAFWPFRPAYGSTGETEHGVWTRVARLVGRRPRVVWVLTVLGLAILAAFLPQFKANGVAQTDVFRNRVDSVVGQEAIARHFPAGEGSPAVTIARADASSRVIDAARSVPGVQSVALVTAGPPGPPQPGTAPAPPRVVDGLVEIDATLNSAPDSETAIETVKKLRTAVRGVPGADAKVGGPTAIQADTQSTSRRDLRVLIPIVLAVILVILVLLLRALVAPTVLISTVVLSFAATIGVSALFFNHVFNFPGADPSTPLFGFIFLVALGIDYNIFLMTRVREESAKIGTREGTLMALRVTGGVITSAGVVLAATFAALAVIPILFLAQVAFIVAFGVLLDTLIVRSLLVPALTVDIGRPIWWPGKLRRGKD